MAKVRVRAMEGKGWSHEPNVFLCISKCTLGTLIDFGGRGHNFVRYKGVR